MKQYISPSIKLHHMRHKFTLLSDSEVKTTSIIDEKTNVQLSKQSLLFFGFNDSDGDSEN